MCLAIPARVEAIDRTTDNAVVALANVKKTVSIVLLEDVQVGDYVLLHVGYALHKISEAEAERTLALFDEAELLAELDESLA
jgi:hydrogenase expression/formation protein HypC